MNNKIPIEQFFCDAGQNSGPTGETPSLIVITVLPRGLGVLVVVVAAVVLVPELPEVLAPGLEPEHGREDRGQDEPGGEHDGDGPGGRQGRGRNLRGRGGIR